METAAILESVDPEILTNLVRRAKGTDSFMIAEWSHHALHGGVGATSGGVYRFQCTGIDRGEAQDCSLVLKIVRQAPGTDDPTFIDYWRRELLVYQSGLLDDLPPAVRAPRCFGWVEYDDTYCLWLEDIVDEESKPWPVARFGLAALHLATFNGRYLVNRAMPLHPWLTRGALRSFVERWSPSRDLLRDLHDHPLVQRGWPDDQLVRVERLWEECLEFIGVLDSLPRTLCHGDANPFNLFARNGPDDLHQTVAIDWAFTGIGALGEELATLLRSDTRENATYEELDQAIFSGYLEGLHEVGWLGDSRLARLGYATAAALRYGLNAWPVNVIVDPLARTQVEQAFGVTIEAFLDWAARIRHHALLLADESRLLRGELQVGG